MYRTIFHFFRFYYAEMRRKFCIWRVPWARCQKIFKFTLYIEIFVRNQTNKFTIDPELYCDTNIFIFWSFIVYLQKKWKLRNGPRLSTLRYYFSYVYSLTVIFTHIFIYISFYILMLFFSTVFFLYINICRIVF